MPDVPTRRPHTKSRLGCVQCKARKVKCDQAAPTCSNCVRRKQACSLTDAHLHIVNSNHIAKSINSPVPVVPESTKGAPKANQDAPSPQDFSLIDLELIHFYATQTCNTLMMRPQAAILWKGAIFDLALRQPPLLDALLSTAAMHKLALDRDHPNRDAYIAVIMQKGPSIIPYMLEMMRVPLDKTNVPLLVGSILFTIWSFASFLLPREANLFTTPTFAANASSPLNLEGSATPKLDDLLSLLNMSMGTRVVAVSMVTKVRTGGFEALLASPKYDTLDPPPGDIIIALNSLAGHCKAYQSTSTRSSSSVEFSTEEIYNTQIGRLYEVFRVVHLPEWWDMVISFAIGLPKKMLTLLARREPPALVMLAYWVAALHISNHTWWVRGWPKVLFEEIERVLDAEWRAHLRVPDNIFAKL